MKGGDTTGREPSGNGTAVTLGEVMVGSGVESYCEVEKRSILVVGDQVVYYPCRRTFWTLSTDKRWQNRRGRSEEE